MQGTGQKIISAKLGDPTGCSTKQQGSGQTNGSAARHLNRFPVIDRTCSATPTGTTHVTVTGISSCSVTVTCSTAFGHLLGHAICLLNHLINVADLHRHIRNTVKNTALSSKPAATLKVYLGPSRRSKQLTHKRGVLPHVTESICVHD